MDRLLNWHIRIFGRRFVALKTVFAILFLLTTIVANLGILTYLGFFGQSGYEVKNLKVVQEGINLKLTWDKDDCYGYEVYLMQDKKRPKTFMVEKNYCLIELSELNMKYSVIVTAKGEGGGNHGAKTASIYTRKVKQEIVTAKDSFAGFEDGDGYLGARAPGEMAFASNNEKIVRVGPKGGLRYGTRGRAEITITAGETPQYRPGRKKVSVTVYPEALETPTLQVANKDDFTSKLSWNQIPFAQGYVLQKYSPVLDAYENFKEFKANETSIELQRNQAKYRVKAVAKVESVDVESKHSKAAEIQSTAATAETYGSYKNLKTLDHSNLEVVTSVKGIGRASVPQSMSLVDGNFVIAYASHDGNTGALVAYDQNGNRVKEASVSGMGHGNGSTYNPNTGRIYTVKTHKGIRSNSCTVYDGSSFSNAESFNLPRQCSGIAYDDSNDKFYLAKGNELYVTDSKFNVEHAYGKFIRYNHSQDVGGYNGVIMVVTWVSGNESYIDMYRASDGKYIGGYSVPIGEAESCLVLDKHLYILMNNTDGHNVDQILRTVDPISIP